MGQRGSDSKEFRYSLLENGLDFINRGLVEIVEAKVPSDLKYAVLHLGAGIELILKERVRREDWRLIFADRAKADEKKYERGDFRSINLHDCLQRLDDIGVEVIPESKAKLAAFYDRRNRVQHFQFTDTREAIESASVDVIFVILDFISEELSGGSLARQEDQLLTMIRGHLAEFKRFTDKRMQLITPLLKELKGEFGAIVECPSCLQKTLSTDVEVECPFCGYKAMAEDAADLYITNVLGDSAYRLEKDGEYYPLFFCPNCDNEALIEDHDGRFLCFSCGFRAHGGILKLCESCGHPKDRDGFVGFRCADCDRDYLMQDNT